MIRIIKRFRFALTALATAIALTVGISTQAFAANLPGEGSTWQPEIEANTAIRSHETLSEAHDTSGNIVQVWRGWDNNNIYLSINHGVARHWGDNNNPGGATQTPGAATQTAPRVIWTDYGFRIFHVGVDGHIYYAGITFGSGGGNPFLGSWVEVPNNAVTTPWTSVAVVALPHGSWLLAWLGATNVNIYSTYFDGNTHSYSAPSQIPGASSVDAPAMAYDPSWGQVIMVYRNTESSLVTMQRQNYGSSSWTAPQEPGFSGGGLVTYGSPSIALTNNGNGIISARNQGGGYRSMTLSRSGTVAGWFDETTNFRPLTAAWATAVGAVIYWLMTAQDGYVYWKVAGRF
ncbi:hypothetical protein [Streptomyces sp. NPDC086010]|uniref:hypothetical protein n=1 Tax=Streptomyces sp. NPDC086010 TaxID=3365745 RepID=UPI0037D0A1A2